MTRPAPLRIAFTHIPRQVWAGGYNYLGNLFAALGRFREGEFTPVLFAGDHQDDTDLAALAAIAGVEVVRSAAFEAGTGLAAALAFGLDREASGEFRAQRIDLVFENARFFGWRLPYPAVAWFPDFQHRKLPQLFPAAARWRREAGFRIQIASERIIMLSSESSHRDFTKYYPQATNEVRVVRFATQPLPEFLTTNLVEIVTQYRLPEKYFYLPNQFYRHKNHQVVVDALAILAQRLRRRRMRIGQHRGSARARLFRQGNGAGAKSWSRNELPSFGNDSAAACVRVVAGVHRTDKSIPIRGMEHNR